MTDREKALLALDKIQEAASGCGGFTIEDTEDWTETIRAALQEKPVINTDLLLGEISVVLGLGKDDAKTATRILQAVKYIATKYHLTPKENDNG